MSNNLKVLMFLTLVLNQFLLFAEMFLVLLFIAGKLALHSTLIGAMLAILLMGLITTLTLKEL